MDTGPLRALALALNLETHGVAITVTRPGFAAIETRGIWLTRTTEDAPTSGEFRRREPRRVMVLSRAVVPTVPRDTVIVAPEKAGEDEVERYWKVDSIDRLSADHVRVMVVEIEEGEA